jgi:transposase
MKLHRNAKSTLISRFLLVRRVLFEGWTYAEAAEGAGVSIRTVAKWVRRFREAGIAGLEDGLSSNACSIASLSATWTIRSRVADIPSARATILYVFRLADFI